MTNKLSVQDMKKVAEFNRIVKNYKKMKRIKNGNGINDSKAISLSLLPEIIDSLQNMVAIAYKEEWYKSTTGRQIILKDAEKILAKVKVNE